MSQYSPSKDLQSKSKSIYSDACQNEAELNQILNRRQRQKKRVKTRTKNSDNSFIKLNSKDKIIVKNLEEVNEKHIYSSSEYRSFHEEEIENKNDNNNLDKNLNIDEKMRQFDISSINSNSNKQNFMEENTDLELNKIFGYLYYCI